MKIEHLRKAEDLYLNQGSITREDIQRLLNVSEHEARIIRQIVTDRETIEAFANDSKGETSVYKEESDNKQTIITKSSEIRTLQELIDFCDVDLSEWEISKHVINSWGSDTNECFQVKAWLKKKTADLNIDDILEDFRKKAEKHSPNYTPVKYKKGKDHLLEICTHDFHLGQLSWGKETRFSDYDINIAKKVYLESVEYFISHAATYNPDRIVFLLGSDFFNTDNEDNTTSNGTGQDSDSRWQKSFNEGCDLAIEALDLCRESAPVDVVVVRGNHDNKMSYALGKYLEAWYRKCKEVTIDNTPPIRKYYEYGRNLLGYAHKGTIDKLPLLMAQEAPEAWGRTNVREMKTGHLHHKKKYIFIPVDENQGVRVVQCSSLAPRDAWHSESGYYSLREANGNIWHPEEGNVANFNFQPRG